uniref:Peptidase A1 domain-containing protein n=2 Tax=Bursaphelenchus xylophilus TaxID=6326 RepID=A0A1I7SHZ5_BURXY
FGGKNDQTLRLKHKVMFGAGEELTYDDDGVLGLSFPKEGQEHMNIFAQAAKEGILDAPMFTVYMKKCGGTCADAGKITFGGYDRENCCNVKAWAKVVPTTFHWNFQIEAARIDDEPLTPGLAMTDTGSTVISAPRADFEKIMKKIKATPYKSAYLSFCSAEFTLHFKIAGKEFHIPSNQILHPLNSNCQVMISASNDDKWTLGDPFIRQYCQVHDFKGKRVGFAPAREIDY